MTRWIGAIAACIAGASSCAHRPQMALDPPPLCSAIRSNAAQAVSWIAPVAERDRTRLADWCRTVGSVLVQPADTGTDPAPGYELAVVTWNVHVGGGDLAGVIARLRRGEFTGGRPVENFAMVLQETHRQGGDVPSDLPPGAPLPPSIVEHPPGGVRRDIKAVAEEAGLGVFYAPAMRNERIAIPEDRGTAILSTLPLEELRVIELPFERQRRIALAATIVGRGPGDDRWRLRLAGVHVDTSLALTRGGPFAARRRQAEALVEALAAEQGYPTIVGGDFNTWLGPMEPAVSVMRRAFPETPRQPDLPTWRGPFGARAALDYVFARGDFASITTRRLPARYGSDHFPLLTMVQVKPAASLRAALPRP